MDKLAGNRGHVPIAVRIARRIVGSDIAFAVYDDNGAPTVEAIGLDEGKEADARAVAALVARSVTGFQATSLDDRLKGNALFGPEGSYRSVAGVPLLGMNGFPLGALVVATAQARVLDLSALSSIALVIENDLTFAVPEEEAPPAATSCGLLDNRVLDTLNDGILILDANGRIARHNDVAAQLVGATGSLEGRLITDFVAERHILQLQDHFKVEDAAPDVRLMSLKRVEGKSGRIEVTTSALRENAKPVYVSVIRNASPTPATQEGTQSVPRASQRIEEALERQIHFVRKVSHEFRSALTGINAFSEMIRDGDLADHEVREYAHDIHIDAQRLTRLCDDLLVAEQMIEPTQDLWKASVDLVELAKHLTDRHTVVDPDHKYTFVADAGSIRIDADGDRLAQAITNLLDNAAKYSDPGTKIALAVSSADGFARVDVSDEGAGIGKDKLNRIFEHYFRDDEVLAEGIPGAGLGLTVVRRIVELHGGRVEVASEVDVGSSFSIIVPIGEPTI